MKRLGHVNETLKMLFILDLNKKKANRKIIRWFIGLLLLSALNRLVFLSQGIFLLSVCADVHQNNSFGEFFFHQIFPEFFKVLPFHFILGIFVLTADSLLSISYAINDGFIIVVSLMTVRSYETFNRRILLNINVRKVEFVALNYFNFYPQNKSSRFWIDHIDAYKLLCDYVAYTNGIIGVAILISFLTNMYIVCVKLLITIR